MKKYEFTGKKMKFQGVVLQQIKYLYDCMFFGTGELGGWIESEANLSHEGCSCILDEAKVFGSAKVMDNAVVDKKAVVKDNVEQEK